MIFDKKAHQSRGCETNDFQESIVKPLWFKIIIHAGVAPRCRAGRISENIWNKRCRFKISNKISFCDLDYEKIVFDRIS